MNAESGDALPDEIVDLDGFVKATENIQTRFNALLGMPDTTDDHDRQDRQATESEVDEAPAGEGNFGMTFEKRAYPGHYEHRVQATVRISGYRLVADVVVAITVPENVRPTNEAFELHASKVGAFVAYPYVSEGIQSLASRFRLPPFSLPVMNDGDVIVVDVEDPSEPMEYATRPGH